MGKERLNKFIELSKKMAAAVTFIGVELRGRGYNNFIPIMSTNGDFASANLWMPSLQWDKYIDDLIDEVKENLCISEKFGKAYILDIVRTFGVMDTWCHPDYNIENNEIQEKGIIAGYKKIRTHETNQAYKKWNRKISEVKTSDAGEFAINYAILYTNFKKAFILACSDCGFDYFEIINDTPIIDRDIWNHNTPARCSISPKRTNKSGSLDDRDSCLKEVVEAVNNFKQSDYIVEIIRSQISKYSSIIGDIKYIEHIKLNLWGNLNIYGRGNAIMNPDKPNNIYLNLHALEESYIDKDKNPLGLQGQIKPQTCTVVTIPDELASDEAKQYLNRAVEKGYLTPEYQWIEQGHTRYQQTHLAFLFHEKLKYKYKWRPFEQFWNYKRFAQTYKAIQDNATIDNVDELESIFD